MLILWMFDDSNIQSSNVIIFFAHFRAETERGLSRKHIIEGAVQFYLLTFLMHIYVYVWPCASSLVTSALFNMSRGRIVYTPQLLHCQ